MSESFKIMLRDFLTGLVVLSVLILTVFAYTDIWPPFVAVESSSMQHEEDQAGFGAIDTGDLVLLQKTTKIITYVEGRTLDYSSYGDYGDVIVFKNPVMPWADPIIHRAIMYVTFNEGAGYAVSGLSSLPKSEWGMIDNTTVWISNMGWRQDLNITFRLATLGYRSGYVTMGDLNAYHGGYDAWIASPDLVIGRARGEIPSVGLITLMASGMSWGDSQAPANAWTGLLVGLSTTIVTTLIIEVWRARKLRKENE